MDKESASKFLSRCEVVGEENRHAPEFKQFHQECLDWGEKSYMKIGQIPPHWIIQSHTRRHLIVTPFNNKEEKEVAAILIKSWLPIIGAVYYSLVSEAWSLSISKDAKIPDSIGNHPDKTEILMVSSENHNTCISTSWDIVREGWKISLKNQNTVSSLKTHSSGRFVGLLKQK